MYIRCMSYNIYIYFIHFTKAAELRVLDTFIQTEMDVPKHYRYHPVSELSYVHASLDVVD